MGDMNNRIIHPTILLSRHQPLIIGDAGVSKTVVLIRFDDKIEKEELPRSNTNITRKILSSKNRK